MNKFALLATLILVINTGCTSTSKPNDSGFLGNNIKLIKSGKFDDTWVNISPTFNRQQLAAVKKIKLIPFEVWLKQNTQLKEKTINTTQLRKLHGYFHDKLTATLKGNYQIVEIADEDTLTIRGAFTKINLAKPELKATDFIPIRLVLNAGNSAYLMTTEQQDIVANVAIEVEFLLGSNQQRVFAMKAEKIIDLTVANSVEGNFTAVTQVLDIWADNFAKKLTQIRNEKTSNNH